MIEIKNLSAGYKNRIALSGCNAGINSGEITAVLGLNGAGKTTLIRSILGFIPERSGSVTVDGQLLDDGKRRVSARDQAKLLSYVPQRSDDGFSYTCEEFVAMGAASDLGTFSAPDHSTLSHAREILIQLGCSHLVHRSLDQVSGGENRMAYLARAMMQDAKYMLMDEPVSSLDLSKQHIFLRSLRKYVDESGRGCLLSIHDPALILAVADHFLVMQGGRIVKDIHKSDEGFEEKFDEALHILYGDDLIITHMEKGAVALVTPLFY